MLRILSITGLFLLSLLPSRGEAKSCALVTDNLFVHVESQSSEIRPHRFAGETVKTLSPRKKKKRATITKIPALPVQDVCTRITGAASFNHFSPGFARVGSPSIRDRSPPYSL
jgi:hypothetical protein